MRKSNRKRTLRIPKVQPNFGNWMREFAKTQVECGNTIENLVKRLGVDKEVFDKWRVYELDPPMTWYDQLRNKVDRIAIVCDRCNLQQFTAKCDCPPVEVSEPIVGEDSTNNSVVSESEADRLLKAIYLEMVKNNKMLTEFLSAFGVGEKKF